MAYCRKGPDSDLYVIGTGDGYECLCCPLTETVEVINGAKMYGSRHFRNISHLYSHLLDHVGAGHNVPQDALDRVEAEELGKEYVDPEIAFWLLLERLAAPRVVFEHLVRSQRITDMLDELTESGWESYPEDFFYDDEGWNQP